MSGPKELYPVAVTPEFKDGAFIWGFEDARMGHLRYTIRLVDERWFEIGERSPDAKTWVKFFEMTLTNSPAR